MVENYDTAREELKRADHLLYISLKYTRTTDVMKSVISRLINAFDFAILDSLNYLKNKKRVKTIFSNEMARAEDLKKKIRKFKSYLELYFLLRRIEKTKHTSKEEFRKHVTLITDFVEVDTPQLIEYFKKTKEFIMIVEEMVND